MSIAKRGLGIGQRDTSGRWISAHSESLNCCARDATPYENILTPNFCTKNIEWKSFLILVRYTRTQGNTIVGINELNKTRVYFQSTCEQIVQFPDQCSHGCTSQQVWSSKRFWDVNLWSRLKWYVPPGLLQLSDRLDYHTGVCMMFLADSSMGWIVELPTKPKSVQFPSWH